jgi:hypothetical protein
MKTVKHTQRRKTKQGNLDTDSNSNNYNNNNNNYWPKDINERDLGPD